MTQGVAILGISSTPNGTESLKIIGPVTRSDLRRVGTGISSRVPSFSLNQNQWVQWARNTWAVPRLPRDQIERKNILKILDTMSQLPRLGDHDHWLATQDQTVKVRVGEIDQTAHSNNISSWDKTKSSRPFIRGFTSLKMRLVESTFDTLHSERTFLLGRMNANWPCGLGKLKSKLTVLAWPAKQSSMHIKNVAFVGQSFHKDVFLATVSTTSK